MQNTTAPAAHLARDYAALTGTGVTEAHARYCREHGHATHTVDGVAQPHCPRCGDTLPDPDVAADLRDAEIRALTEVTEADRSEAALHARPRTRRFDRGTGRYAVTVGGYITGYVQREDNDTWSAYVEAGNLRVLDRGYPTRAHAVEAVGRTDHAVKLYREAAREGTFGTAAERVERRRIEAVNAVAAREAEVQADADPERDDEGNVTADLVDAAPVTMDCQGGSARCTGVVAERGMVVAALAGDLSRMPYCPPCRVAAAADAVLDEPVQGPAHAVFEPMVGEYETERSLGPYFTRAEALQALGEWLLDHADEAGPSYARLLDVEFVPIAVPVQRPCPRCGTVRGSGCATCRPDSVLGG